MGRPNRDLTGERIGTLVALRRAGRVCDVTHRTMWVCRCDCGEDVEVSSFEFAPSRRNATSCGNSMCNGRARRLAGHYDGYERKTPTGGLTNRELATALGVTVDALAKRRKRGWKPFDVVGVENTRMARGAKGGE